MKPTGDWLTPMSPFPRRNRELKSHKLVTAAFVVCAALGLETVGLGGAASATAGGPVAQAATVQDTLVFLFEGRIVTIRQEGALTRATISRAVPGDSVSLTDRNGRQWPAVVPPGGTTASTPWVVDAVSGNARTVEGRQRYFSLGNAV
jgi:hypothetical protein